MHIIAISNRKGGAGKTTVSVNLAAELAASGLRVLLIDMDTQGHCAVGLGVKVLAADSTVHHLFVNAQATLSMAIRKTAISNLWLAPADQRFDHGSGERNDLRLRNAIESELLGARFDVIIIDTPPSLDSLLINGLVAADRVLVPYIPHHLSFEGVRQLMRVIFKVMTRDNRKLKILGFLPTMQAEHVRQHRTISARVKHDFGPSRVLSGIRNDIRLAESFEVGAPIRCYAPKSRGAEDFARLASELKTHLTQLNL